MLFQCAARRVNRPAEISTAKYHLKTSAFLREAPLQRPKPATFSYFVPFSVFFYFVILLFVSFVRFCFSFTLFFLFLTSFSFVLFRFRLLVLSRVVDSQSAGAKRFPESAPLHYWPRRRYLTKLQAIITLPAKPVTSVLFQSNFANSSSVDPHQL
jgi:hypothetical protein